jgi:hypothetical protein
VTGVLSIGYVTLLQAAEMLQPSMFAGVPDQAAVIRLSQMGANVSDGLATDRAIAEIWKAVDLGTVRPMVVGGRRRRIVRLDPAITKQIPTLRSPRGRGFTFLRPSNAAFHQLAGWFGPDLLNVTLAFRETEIQKLARRLARTRRRMSVSDDTKRRVGRPSRQAALEPVIRELVEGGKWNPLMGLKALARAANRLGRWTKPMSEDTVARALDHLYEQTKDRRYNRVRRTRR